MKAHFGKGDYDFVKFNGKTKVSRDSFWKRKEIEPESVTRLISKSLKDKIEANARDLNYLPNQAKLPI